MALLLDRFGDNSVLAICAGRLEEAVAHLEERIEPLDCQSQTRLLNDLTDKFIEQISWAASEAVRLNEHPQ